MSPFKIASYFILFLGIACMAVAIRVGNDSGAGPGLRAISPEDAELVQGAACTLYGVNNDWVCQKGNAPDTCTPSGWSACSSRACVIWCRIARIQPVRTVCSGGIIPCTTAPCQNAQGVPNTACPAIYYDQLTCSGTVYCSCDPPTTRFWCPADTFTRWDSCP
jgi:hypothetical protein